MSTSEASVGLHEHQAPTFRDQGFTFVDRITSAAEVETLRGMYDEILTHEQALRLQYSGENPDGAAAVITQIFAPELQRPELLETGYITNGRRLAAELLGIDEGDCTYGGVMLIYKPAGAGLPTPFHQDEAYWEFPGERLSHSLSVWMPLDEVTVDSGCMQFVPGSHQGEVLLHKRDNPSLPLMLDEPFDTSAAVPVPLPPGGASFHHCRTVHGGEANTSERHRRAFTCIFHGPPGIREVRLSRPWLGLP